MVNGAQPKVALERAEGFLHQLHVAAPQQRGILGAEVGAQELPAFATAHGAPFGPVLGVGEFACCGHGHFHQAGGDASGPVAGGAELLQQRVAGEILLL